MQRLGVDDPRLEPYRNLKRTNLTRWSGRFIAEGGKVVERLLASSFTTDSVLLCQRREDFLDRVPAGVPVFTLCEQDCRRLTGFEFHQGVLACGVRRPSPPLDEILRPGRLTLAVATRMTDPDNLGALLRLAAAFGLTGVLLGPGSADPFSRRALRVSMGATLTVPIVEATDLVGALEGLKRHGVELVATVLDAGAESLASAPRSERIGLLFGNEARGLLDAEIAACDRRVTIPMSGETDSLNVAAAAAVFLWHFAKVAGAGPEARNLRESGPSRPA